MKKIEYLITIINPGTFCSNVKSFVGFLNSDEQIKITDKIITYQKQEIKYNLIEKKNKSFINFELTLYFGEKLNDELILGLTKLLRTNILKIKKGDTYLKILWDDLAREYSIEAYPIINKLENLMRLFISKFMISNVGVDWFSTQIHDDIKKKRKNDDKNNNVGQLYDDVFNLDFIDLADVIFKPYRTMKIEDVDKIIDDHSYDERKDIPIELIRGIYPQSNWDRHFKNIIDKNITDSFIKKHWENLYNIRNSIAHNRLLDKQNLEELKRISNELTPILEKAISALANIKLTDEEKELTKAFPKEQNLNDAYLRFQNLYNKYDFVHRQSLLKSLEEICTKLIQQNNKE